MLTDYYLEHLRSRVASLLEAEISAGARGSYGEATEINEKRCALQRQIDDHLFWRSFASPFARTSVPLYPSAGSPA
jgi:retron-type reverse transcriptase